MTHIIPQILAAQARAQFGRMAAFNALAERRAAQRRRERIEALAQRQARRLARAAEASGTEPRS